MHTSKSHALRVSVLFVFAYLVLCSTASDLRAMQSSLEARYAHAHSLGNNYHFSARDGWQTVNVSNLQYKYRRDSPDVEDDEDGGGEGADDTNVFDDSGDLYAVNEGDLFGLTKRANKNITFNPSSKAKLRAVAKGKARARVAASKSSSSRKGGTKDSKKTANKPTKDARKKTSNSNKGGLASSVKSILASLKGTGTAEPVTITWYTGHDLENPSCWPNPVWAPTDAAFACALTLEGWTSRPKCFKFLELCNTPKKCVFVRVVDSCAGCKKGSKHVDLTQAAFKELANLDEGLLQVQMRQATDPDGWLENLWGPRK